MPGRTKVTAIDNLVHLLDEAYDQPAWHGPNLKAALRGVSAAMAAWAPHRGRHSIREIVLHAAYWKYQVRRRLANSKAPPFAARGHNWFSFPARNAEWDEKAWKSVRALLESEHRQLRRAVSGLRAVQLAGPAGPNGQTIARNVAGIALHDVYHVGQIQLLKRLIEARRRG